MAGTPGQDKFKDEKLFGFPIKVEAGENIQFVGGVPLSQWIVCANGLVIAHFIDEFHMLVYLEFLKQGGLKKFPKKIIDLLRDYHQLNQLGVQTVVNGELKK